jgi:hypothetical protein
MGSPTFEYLAFIACLIMAFHTWKAIKDRKGLTKQGVFLLEVGLAVGWGIFGLAFSGFTRDPFLQTGVAFLGIACVEMMANLIPALDCFSLNLPEPAAQEAVESGPTSIRGLIGSTMKEGDTHEPDPQSLPPQRTGS